jgi:hypothetical protein
VLGELLDRAAAIEQDAFVAVDIVIFDSQLPVEVYPGS